MKTSTILEKKSKRASTAAAPDTSQLHPLNPYKDQTPNYVDLARMYPEGIGKFVSSKDGSIDFTDSHAVIELNKALLHSDFGLDVNFHEDRLCPPLPNRLNYICWLWELSQLQDISHSTRVSVDGVDNSCHNDENNGSDGSGMIRSSTTIVQDEHVLDIGTGASCIYPLLGAKMYGWRYSGVDIDEESLDWARKNVDSNSSVSSLITLAHVTDEQSSIELQKIMSAVLASSIDSDGIISGPTENRKSAMTPNPAHRLSEAISKFSAARPLGPLANSLIALGNPTDITAIMTNPPFYSELDRIERNPRTICTGNENEMMTTGGEVAFVGAIIADSLMYKEKISWYSSMLGKKSSLQPLLKLLVDLKVTNVRTVRFVGGVTTRWGIAWSFTNKGAQMLPYIGRSSDPKLIDIESLKKLLIVKSDFVVTTSDVWLGMLPEEKDENSTADIFPLLPALCARVYRCFHDIQKSSANWTYAFSSPSYSSGELALEISGRESNLTEIQTHLNSPHLEISVQVELLGIDNTDIRVKYECKCLSNALTVKAREVFDSFKVGVQRNNRRWRRLLSQSDNKAKEEVIESSPKKKARTA